MSDESVKLLSMALAVGLGVIGPGVGIGIVFGKAIEAISRNPETENNVRTNMFLGVAFCEALAIFALVIGFIIRYT